MGKRLKRGSAPPGPTTLEMRLHAPGMSLLHRAGLGGLACTLKYIERARRNGSLPDNRIPGDPWKDGKPPWLITPTMVTLDFGTAGGAEKFLKRLFAAAFQIEGGLICLPGQYGDVPPSKAVLAELHNATLLTFLQHGNVRKTGKEAVMSYDPDGTGMASVTLAYKPCSKYKHQDASKEMISALKGKPVEVVGPLSPGALVRHVAFAAHTKIVEVAERILPLYFALVGCLSLSVNRGVGVLVIPDVHDLESFAALREAMTPTSTKECRITSASDAALQSQVRLHSRWAIAAAGIPACQAVTFKPTPWARQQKSRTAVAHVDSGNDAVLDLFEKALAELPPRIRSKPITEGKGKSKTTRTEYFWVDSRIRPLIADNLAQGNPWYANFATLVSTPEKARSISFEKKGLHAMIEKIAWDNAGAETIVKAVHEAIRQRFGRIADENKGRPVAMKNRWNGERERWRLAFVGAKTADQFRDALADLWSRAGSNPVLRQAWASVLPMLADQRWKLARDLALVGLASYAGKEAAGTDVTETQNEGDQE